MSLAPIFSYSNADIQKKDIVNDNRKKKLDYTDKLRKSQEKLPWLCFRFKAKIYKFLFNILLTIKDKERKKIV